MGKCDVTLKHCDFFNYLLKKRLASNNNCSGNRSEWSLHFYCQKRPYRMLLEKYRSSWYWNRLHVAADPSLTPRSPSDGCSSSSRCRLGGWRSNKVNCWWMRRQIFPSLSFRRWALNFEASRDQKISCCAQIRRFDSERKCNYVRILRFQFSLVLCLQEKLVELVGDVLFKWINSSQL